MSDLLNDQQINDQLHKLSGWQRDGNTIVRTLEKKGFLGALNVLNAVGYIANEAKHHPDLSVHDYNQVTVRLTSHSEGGLTQTDFDVAAAVDGLLASPSPNTGE